MDDDQVQQFNLRWHNHQNSVIGALSHMWTTGALTDVTLSANGTILKAHKLVLASCSQYFAQLFKEVDHDSTLVVVLDCGASSLRLLLSFMYSGQVTASRAALPPLLALAAALQVAGFTDAYLDLSIYSGDVEVHSSTLVVALDCGASSLRLLLSFMYSGQVTASRAALPPLLALASALQVAGFTDASPTFLPAEPETKEDPKPEPISPINLQNKPETNDNSNSLDNNSNFRFNFDDLSGNTERQTEYRHEERLSKLDQIVQNLYSTHRIEGPTLPVLPPVPTTPPVSSSFDETPETRKWRSRVTCPVCHKRLSNQYNLRVHMDTHAGALHACRACDHVSRSRDALRKHRAYRHPPRPSQ
ncbi:unnamed protein product [Plutella xylostella]|uniref:(diamondback moth) hypothetical protein n=1 Tax=Plutella xylostella TaxID=51655 RepID=A0A8S4FVB0_PLUXY|nr:unnamed protein product [Plutella xylostella]